MNLDSQALPSDLAGRVLDRLGFPHPPPLDFSGLAALYRAWCMRVPFDNTRKMIALRRGADAPLPGAHAEEFLDYWLAHGTGGTCWPSSNALCSLLQAAGFSARRVTASMRDVGVPNHASTIVCVDDHDWLVDSSMLLNAPLPLGPDVFMRRDPVWPAEVESSNGGYLIWWHTPPGAEYFPCRLRTDPAQSQEYLDGYERSRGRSPFNQRLYARRNLPGALVMLIGRTRYLRDEHGVRSYELTASELQQALHDDIGLSLEMIGRWSDSGARAAALETPETAPPLPPEIRQPPSKRRTDADPSED